MHRICVYIMSFVFVIVVIFFFFKQKTAYEMRISDWSSDVCSSDLGLYTVPQKPRAGGVKTPVPCPTPPGRSFASHSGPSRSTKADRAAIISAGAIDRDEEIMLPVITPSPAAAAASASASAPVSPPVLSSLMLMT